MTKSIKAHVPVVIYLSPGFPDNASDTLFECLTDHGLSAVGCPDITALQSCLASPESQIQNVSIIVLINARLADSLEQTVHVRMLYPAIGIVVLCDMSEHRVVQAHIHAGADVWCPADTPVCILAAQLFRLAWRLQQTEKRKPEPRPSGVWRYSNQGWIILTPEGLPIRLTATERAFMQTLWQTPNGRATHASLQHAIQTSRQMGAGRSGMHLALIVSRLRSKVMRKGAVLPMQSVYSWGYALTMEFSELSSL